MQPITADGEKRIQLQRRLVCKLRAAKYLNTRISGPNVPHILTGDQQMTNKAALYVD